jgi:hypothetical protein
MVDAKGADGPFGTIDSMMTSTAEPSASLLDFIWNITLVCPWDCEFCCTDAVHVSRSGRHVYLREQGLSARATVNVAGPSEGEDTISVLRELGVEPSAFDWALGSRQRRGLELTYEAKLRVLENIRPNEAKFDFAGGDPLACYENLLVIERAAELFSRSNVAVTVTGAGLGRLPPERIASTIGQFEFTYDEPSTRPAVNRPQGYNRSNLMLARQFQALGVRTKAQTPLHLGNIAADAASRIYGDLAEAGVREILLMRTFPVGRGLAGYESRWMLTGDQLRSAIDHFRAEEARSGAVRVRLQCALKQLDGPHLENPCDLMRESFGINPRGQLLLSAWATDPRGDPLDESFLVGDLSAAPFNALVDTPTWRAFRTRLDDNFGQCKIFAFLFGSAQDDEAMLKRRDPLSDDRPLPAGRWIDRLSSGVRDRTR